MSDFAKLGAAVIGTGFIGGVHVQMLRRLGVQVRGVLGSSPERGAEQAEAMGVARAYASLDDCWPTTPWTWCMSPRPTTRITRRSRRCWAPGKHVICEKPLAMTSAESAEMVEIARASGRSPRSATTSASIP